MAIILATFVGLHARYGAPLHPYTADQYAAFVRLNAISAGGLLAFVGLTFSGAFAKAERRE